LKAATPEIASAQQNDLAGRSVIHFNTAGAGLMPAPVVGAMLDVLQQEATTGSYETARRFSEVLQREVYQNVGALIGATAKDVALFDSATRAWCTIVCRLPLQPGDRVWITPYEYAGSIISLLALGARVGFKLEVIPILPDGDIDLDWMAANITDRVALVCVTHIPSGCGIVNPVSEIGALLAAHRCLYAVDACQSVGQVPIDVSEIRCDLLTGAGRKFLRGPRGTGFAYVSPRLRAMLTPSYHDLHVATVTSSDTYLVEDDSSRSLELAEHSLAAVVGLNAAVRYHFAADHSAQRRVYQALQAAVADIPRMQVIAPGSRHSGIVSFVHDRLPADRICHELSQWGINTWLIQGSHTPLYLSARGIDTAVRASVHYYNSLEEVSLFANALRRIVSV